MGLSYDPWGHAHDLGLEVIERPLTRGMCGEYLHYERAIILAPRMTHREARCTLAHEIQHAIAGDVPTEFGPRHFLQERSANRRAALLLVDADEYAAAERLREGHLPSIAHDLAVTRGVLADWRAYFASRSSSVFMA